MDKGTVLKIAVHRSWEGSMGQGIIDRFDQRSTSLSQWGRDLATKFKAEVRECHNNIRVLRPLMDTESVQAYSR
jgi:hypothetical protein